MRIGGFPPVSPSDRPKEGRKSAASAEFSQDRFIKQPDNSRVSYSSPPPQVTKTDEVHLQMKNYVTTIMLRQNWVEKTSHLNVHVMRSGDGLEFSGSTYWQPEQAAKRILSFAQTLGETDATQIDSLQASSLAGIEDTIKMLGGETQTAKMTRNLVLDLFKAWKSQAAAPTEEPDQV